MVKFYKKRAALALAGLLVLSGCGSGGAKEPGTNSAEPVSAAKSSQITIGITNPPLMFNPIDSDGSGSNGASLVYRYLFEPLISTVGPLEFKPRLAESFVTDDNQNFDITLEPDAKWSDGTSVTADDVAFTLNLIANPKTVTTQRAFIAALAGLNKKNMLAEGETAVSGVKVVDDKHLTLSTAKPTDPNLIYERFSDILIVPKHVLKDIEPAKLNESPFWQHPDVTSGPYKFVSFKNKSVVELTANTDYYRGAPQIEKVFIKVMPATNMVAQLQSGELDMNAAQGAGNIPSQEWGTVKSFPNIRTTEERTRRYNSIEINLERFPERTFRQAIAHAINRNTIVEQLMAGTGEVQDGPYSVSHPYHDPNIKKYDYDPELAKQLLEQSGYDASKPIELIIPTGDRTRELAGNIIQQNLQAIGLNIKQVNYDFPTTVSYLVKGNFDMALSSFGSIMDPDGPASIYRSSAALNDMRYSNPRVDELFDLGRYEVDKEKRRAMYTELQNIIQEDLPLVTIYSEYNLIAINTAINGSGGVMEGMHYTVNEWSR